MHPNKCKAAEQREEVRQGRFVMREAHGRAVHFSARVAVVLERWSDAGTTPLP